MVIVIDGYNVLKQLHDEIVSQEERQGYIKTLKRYAKKKSHTIILVFDGGLSDWQSREKYGNVIVIYSGTRYTADDAIKRYLEDNQHKDLLLITDDRQLIDHAQMLKIVALSPRIFDGYVKKALAQLPAGIEFAETQAQKLHPDRNDKELDQLMHEASIMIEHKSEEEINKNRRKRKDCVVSKKDRKVANKLKKL